MIDPTCLCLKCIEAGYPCDNEAECEYCHRCELCCVLTTTCQRVGEKKNGTD